MSPLGAAAEEEIPRDESGWVASIAVTSGVLLQSQSGTQSSSLFDGESADPTAPSPLRPYMGGDDRAVSPFVGGGLELMTPALPLPTRPRFFVSGEFLPLFPPERRLVQEGAPARIRGPEIGAVPAVEETNTRYSTSDLEPGARISPFGESESQGAGMRTSAEIDPFAYGAKAGIAFSAEWRGRRIRIKPSVGWIHYGMEVRGYLADASCLPRTVCTDVYFAPDGQQRRFDGFVRESILQARDEIAFDAFGPGLDIELDTGSFGPLGTALFVGASGYYLPGDRDVRMQDSESYSDALGNDVHSATWHVRVAPWVYRAALGMRFQWLGSAE